MAEEEVIDEEGAKKRILELEELIFKKEILLYSLDANYRAVSKAIVDDLLDDYNTHINRGFAIVTELLEDRL